MAQPTPLRLYNTLTRQKETFQPIDPARVRMYVCGPTVYDFAHIGNARPIIVFDVLYRLLRHVYGEEHVTYVRNITDVDDKINARAAERGVSIRELTDETAKIFHEDVAALGCLTPDVEPRATEHIAEMIAIIEKLIASGHAYAAEGHVLFSVPSMSDYGRLSRRPLDEMIAGARVDVAAYKRDDMDFVLWKPSKDGEPGWDSPWGRGRPGWHIECSAMSWKHLGETFDIHGGGIDLVFPHHENEIAQSRCAFGHSIMANVWMHNGFLQVEGEKMSKSLGNFVTIRELLLGWKGQPWTGNVVKWAMLQAHYRQPIDWTFEGLLASRNELSRIFTYASILNYEFEMQDRSLFDEVRSSVGVSDRVIEALSDDLNTPEAILRIREHAKNLDDRGSLFQCLRDLMFLGVYTERSEWIFSMSSVGMNWPEAHKREIAYLAFDYRVAQANNVPSIVASVEDRAASIGVLISASSPHHVEINGQKNTGINVQDLVNRRIAARNAKDYAESDRIRDELVAMGIQLKDGKGPGGELVTQWEVKR